MPVEHLDVLIVGAGLSGVGAAYHLMKHCPGKSFALLEGRAAMGGTWDLFRYPGIRSDSDMFTLGYNFKPWSDPKAIADGPSIRRYIEETARENGIDRKIRYRHRVLRADWDSANARWNLDVQRGDEPEPLRMTAQFLLMCTGYYRYEAGYTPEFVGREDFAGQVVHPQLWPEDLDYSGKKVVVIGSGATAVTLVPSLTDKAAHVTMLQRPRLGGEGQQAALGLVAVVQRLDAELVAQQGQLPGLRVPAGEGVHAVRQYPALQAVEQQADLAMDFAAGLVDLAVVGDPPLALLRRQRYRRGAGHRQAGHADGAVRQGRDALAERAAMGQQA